jgi:hypothetical protein
MTSPLIDYSLGSNTKNDKRTSLLIDHHLSVNMKDGQKTGPFMITM